MKTPLKTFSVKFNSFKPLIVLSSPFVPKKQIKKLTVLSSTFTSFSNVRKRFNLFSLIVENKPLIKLSANLFSSAKSKIIFSGSIKYSNSPGIDLEYFKKVFSYDQYIVDNIKELYDTYILFSAMNFVPISDESFSDFLSSFRRN